MAKQVAILPRISNYKPMNSLEARINRVINTSAFEQSLAASEIDLIEFQCNWAKSGGFAALPQGYQDAILAGERELAYDGPAVLCS